MRYLIEFFGRKSVAHLRLSRSLLIVPLFVLQTLAQPVGGGSIRLSGQILDLGCVAPQADIQLTAMVYIVSGTTLTAVGVPLQPRRTSTAWIFSSDFDLPAASPGSSLTLTVRVWETAKGSTYSEAASNSGRFGQSALFTVMAGGGILPPSNVPPIQICLVKAPEIISQPLTTTSLSGDSVTFSIQAIGSMPLTYQWQRDGTNLFDNGTFAGSTSSVLRVSSVAPSLVGDYRAVVTNSFGSATSAVARLEVDASPRKLPDLFQSALSISFAPSRARPGDSVTVRWRVNNNMTFGVVLPGSPPLPELFGPAIGSWDEAAFLMANNTRIFLGRVSLTNMFLPPGASLDLTQDFLAL